MVDSVQLNEEEIAGLPLEPMSEQQTAGHLLTLGTKAILVTRGERGSSVLTSAGRTDVAAVPPARIVDPTGVGDAFRGGLLKGLAAGAPYEVCVRLGSVAATYALEHLGGQSHAFQWDEFRRRYEEHFGPLVLASAGRGR